jgi:hypothetical protein
MMPSQLTHEYLYDTLRRIYKGAIDSRSGDDKSINTERNRIQLCRPVTNLPSAGKLKAAEWHLSQNGQKQVIGRIQRSLSWADTSWDIPCWYDVRMFITITTKVLHWILYRLKSNSLLATNAKICVTLICTAISYVVQFHIVSYPQMSRDSSVV